MMKNREKYGAKSVKTLENVVFSGGLKPDCAVIVCSVRALKLHSCEAPKIVAGQTPAKEYQEELEMGIHHIYDSLYDVIH